MHVEGVAGESTRAVLCGFGSVTGWLQEWGLELRMGLRSCCLELSASLGSVLGPGSVVLFSEA